MNIRAYYSEGSASVAFFDVLAAVDPVASDIDLYCDLIPTAGSVLELGSGTGRVSEALANHGYDVTGLELAEPMLKLARARQPHGLKLRYVQGDMCAFALGRQVDAVI